MAGLFGTRFASAYYVGNAAILSSILLVKLYFDSVDPAQRKGQIKNEGELMTWVSAAHAVFAGMRACAHARVRRPCVLPGACKSLRNLRFWG